MSEKRKSLMIGLLVLLCIVLMGVIIYLTISYKSKQEDVINYYKQQLQKQAQESQQKQKETIPELTLEHAKELYNKAEHLSWRASYKLNTQEETVYSEEIRQEVSAVEVLNFDELVDKVFSKVGKQNLLKDTSAFTHNGKIYWVSADRGGDINYVSTEFILKASTEKKVEYTAKSKYIDDKNYTDYAEEYTGNSFRYEENPFVLVFENGRWLIEEFTLAY